MEILMNERIKELAHEAGFNIPQLDFPANLLRTRLQSFSELIVRECMNICQECIDDGCVEAEEPMWKIQEHFGIK